MNPRPPCRALGLAREGIVAMELALIFPFMAIVFFGCFEVTQLVRVYMGLSVATHAMADLLSHGDPDTTAQILDACNGAKLVMAPFTSSTLKAATATVTNVAGVAQLTWSDTSCGSATAIATPLTVAAPMAPNPGDAVIIVQTTYTYNAATSLIMPASYSLSQTAFARPRVPGS